MGANAEVVRSVYDSFAKGDVEAVLAAFDEKIDWQEPESLPYENQVGPQAVAENIFGRVVQDIQDFSVTPNEIHDAGDVVFAIGDYRGKGAGGDLDAAFVHVWRLRDGKVAGFRTYTDTHSWLQAFGEG